jgi:hypothetical protein
MWLEGRTFSVFLGLMKKLGAEITNDRQYRFLIPSEASPEPVTPKTLKPEDEKTGQEAPYSLATSSEGLGELYPVIVDKFGNVIDGNHRLGENPNWHKEVRPQIDSPKKLQLAMLASNFNRRNMTAEEITQRITFLLNEGMKPAEIAKVAGISERTIAKYTPQELKDRKKVEAGKASKLQNSAEDVQQTVNTQDKKLADALLEAKYMRCPTCGADPVKISDMDLPYVNCLRGHEWHLQKGAIMTEKAHVKKAELPRTEENFGYLARLRPCSCCHLMFDLTEVQDGKCRDCRAKEAAAATKAALDKELNAAMRIPESESKQEQKPSAVKSELEEEQQIEDKINEPITFLVTFPESITVDAKQLNDLLTMYMDAALPRKIVKQTDAGIITVTLELSEWLDIHYEERGQTSEADLFKGEVVSILEAQNIVGCRDAEQIVVSQLGASLGETVLEQSQIKEQTVESTEEAKACPCPLCNLPLSPEKYATVKTLFLKKYPELFGETPKPKQKTIKCSCGQEILILPDIKAMAKAIEDHVNVCCYGKTLLEKSDLVLRLTQDLLIAVADFQEGGQ